MKKHIDLSTIDFETTSHYDHLVAQQRNDSWKRKKLKNKASNKKHRAKVEDITFQTRPCADFSPYTPIFSTIRKLMAEGQLFPVKVARGGKNAELFEKQEFYMMNHQLVYINDKLEQYDASDEMVTYIHAVNEDGNEILQPLSVFKIMAGHMPKIEQIQFENGKPALHSPRYL